MDEERRSADELLQSAGEESGGTGVTHTHILALVLAGGEGTRLRPLTAHQAKPAVHFARGHRIVDFVLANLVNSRIPSIYLLAQYRPETLIEHVDAVWCAPARGRGVEIDTVVPEDADLPGGGFKGTADAVRCCLHLLERHAPDVVAVFAADHIYRMDVRQMVSFHRARNADVTLAGLPVPIAGASAFGIIATDAEQRLTRFEEKPSQPAEIPGVPGHAYASMGNYLFKPEVLVTLLEEAHGRGGIDFGKDILPALPSSGLRAYTYDFGRNRVPGIQPYEEPMYWRDVGTLAALARAQADVEGYRPRFDLRNRAWPIRRDLLAPLGRMPAVSVAALPDLYAA